MIKYYRALQYFTQVVYDSKRLSILLLLSILLPLFGYGLCGVFDFPPDQLDLYSANISNALIYYVFSLLPIVMIFMFNLFQSINLATSYRTSQDYICLAGTLTRAQVIIGKTSAAIQSLITFLLIYFTVVQVISMIHSIGLFNRMVVAAIVKILFNGIVCSALTALLAIVTRSAYSGLLTPFLYSLSIVTHNTGVQNYSLKIIKNLINLMMPVFLFNQASGQTQNGIGEASIAFGINYSLVYTLICFGLACLFYNRQDL